MLVLLSERAAHQIWQKWIDTLEVHVLFQMVRSICTVFVCRLRRLKFNYIRIPYPEVTTWSCDTCMHVM